MSGNFILGALAGAALNDAYEHVKAEVTGEQVIDHNLVVNHAILHLLDKLVTETMRAASPLNLEDKYYTVHLSSTNPYFVATRRAKHLSLWTATAVSVDVISPVGTTTIALQVGWNPLDFVDGTALKLHTGGPTDIDVQVALTAELLNILYPPSSGRIIVAAQPLVRPANTTPYVAGQVVSNSTSATTPIAFPVARAGGGSGYIVKARLVIQGTPATFNALTFWLWLYTLSTVTVAVDGAGMTSLWTNRASKVDVIPFYATDYEAGSGSDSVYSIRDDLRIPFVCAGADTNLYGVLETKTGFTPTSAQNFFIELTSDQN